MNLQERIVNDLKKAIVEKSKRADVLKVIIAEFQREKDKKLSDEKIITILKRLKKQEEDLLSVTCDGTSLFWFVVSSYLPSEVDPETIELLKVFLSL